MARSLLLGIAFALASHVAVLADTARVNVRVDASPRQTFRGLGAGCGNWGHAYQTLTRAERDALSQQFWSELRMRSIRLWANLDEVSQAAGECRTEDFRDRYADLVADARARGVDDVLLAPDGMPARMKSKRDGGPADFSLRDDAVDAYAELIAEFILRLRRDAGIAIGVTGVQNEPNDLDRITPAQMPTVVVSLRRALDARGLRDVGIIAPESANVDGVYYDTLDRLRADAGAWGSLAGVASHSYGMGATADAARRADGKAHWVTEASDNGPERPGDAVRAASLASRFLGDLNHGVTHWQHFLAFETADPSDDATRALAYAAGPLRVTTFRKYDVYRAIARAFDAGAVVRPATSDLDGDMAYTYGPKPRVSVAAACNPDGSWAIGVSNFTAEAFAEKPADAGTNNGRHAAAFDVVIRVEELRGRPSLSFAMTRTGGDGHAIAETTIVMRDGVIAVPDVGPLDVVTLRSEAR